MPELVISTPSVRSGQDRRDDHAGVGDDDHAQAFQRACAGRRDRARPRHGVRCRHGSGRAACGRRSAAPARRIRRATDAGCRSPPRRCASASAAVDKRAPARRRPSPRVTSITVSAGAAAERGRRASGASGVTPAIWNRPTAPDEAAAAPNAFSASSPGCAGDAGDDADRIADLAAVEAAEDRPGDVGAEEGRGQGGDIEDQARPAVLRPVQAVVRRAAGRSRRRCRGNRHSGWCARRAPNCRRRRRWTRPRRRRCRTPAGARPGRARRSSSARSRACGRPPSCAAPSTRIGSSSRTREQPIRSSAPTLSVERTATLAPPSTSALGEQRPGIAVIERAVDMRRGDRDQPRRAEQPRAFGDDAHRHRRALAVAAGGDRLLLGGERRGSSEPLAHGHRCRPVDSPDAPCVRSRRSRARERRDGCRSARPASAVRCTGLPAPTRMLLGGLASAGGRRRGPDSAGSDRQLADVEMVGLLGDEDAADDRVAGHAPGSRSPAAPWRASVSDVSRCAEEGGSMTPSI